MDAEKGIHIDKCRLCLRRLSKADDIFFEINETTENRFRTLTSLQLTSTHLLSSNVCASCDENLARFDAFREDLIKKQAVIDRLLRESEEIEDPAMDDTEMETIIEYISEEPLEDETLQECDDIILEENLSPQIEYIETDTESSTIDNRLETSFNCAKVLTRPKAWKWTDAMEADLVRYYKRYKTAEITESYAFKKISKKFEAKGYPNISAKSIKYKYEKLIGDSAKLLSVEQRVMETEDSDEVSDEEETVSKRRRHHSRKTRWTESMELSLIFLFLQAKKEEPAISDNNLHRTVANHFQQAGFSHIFEHNVCYHAKKLKKEDPDRLLYLEGKAKQLTEAFPDSDSPKLQHQTASNKRKYLHWTEDMKKALIDYREGLSRGVPYGLVWPTVARQLESDGYGTFTPKSVMYKYSNLKRQKQTCNTEIN